MKPIISQNLLNMLKNKIIPIISLKLFNDVEFLLNNLFVNNGSNHYFNLIYKIQTSARDMVKSIVISTFEELDNDFKESAYRKTRYFVNKSNVSRTLITIVGEITFKRTYYISKYSNKKFFYIDSIFYLPKLAVPFIKNIGKCHNHQVIPVMIVAKLNPNFFSNSGCNIILHPTSSFPPPINIIGAITRIINIGAPNSNPFITHPIP